MYIRNLPNAAGSVLTVTNTAKSLETLIQEASSDSSFKFKNENAFFIHVEDGDVRLLMDGNTPTASLGVLLKEGEKYYYPNVPISKVKLIRVGGSDVSCSVQVGTSDLGEAAILGGTAPATFSGTLNVDTEFGLATEDAAASTTGPQSMGRYDATPRTLEDGDAGSPALDVSANAQVVGPAAEDAAASGAPVPTGGRYDTTQRTLDNGDRGELAIGADGRAWTEVRDAAGNARGANVNASNELLVNPGASVVGPGNPIVDSYTSASIASVTGANQSLIAAPGANKQIWVYGYHFMADVAGTVALQDEDDTAHTGAMNVGATGGALASPSGNFSMPIIKVATNKALEADVVTATINGWIAYAIVDVS